MDAIELRERPSEEQIKLALLSAGCCGRALMESAIIAAAMSALALMELAEDEEWDIELAAMKAARQAAREHLH